MICEAQVVGMSATTLSGRAGAIDAAGGSREGLLRRSAATARPRQAIRVDHIDGGAGGTGQNLIENVRELDLIFLARHIADVRGGDDLVDREQWMAAVGDR